MPLLRVLPLISSTVNLMWAHDEYTLLSSWTSPSYRAQADNLLPFWLKTWLGRGAYLPLGIGFPLSLGAGFVNIYTNQSGKQWYWLGVGFTAAHFLFAPRALHLLNAIQAGGPNEKATNAMRQWLSMHLARIIVADLPAFVCFTLAATA